MQDFLALWWVNFRPQSKVIMGYHVFLAQALPIVPTAFYGLTLTSSGLNILNSCHNYKLLPSTSTVFYFWESFYSLHHSVFSLPLSLAFKVSFFNSTQPVILIANPWKAEIQNKMIFIDLRDWRAQDVTKHKNTQTRQGEPNTSSASTAVECTQEIELKVALHFTEAIFRFKTFPISQDLPPSQAGWISPGPGQGFRLFRETYVSLYKS